VIEFWSTIPRNWKKAVEAAAKIDHPDARLEAMNAVLDNLKQ